MTQVTSMITPRNTAAALALTGAALLSACSASHEGAAPDSRPASDVVVQSAALESGVQPFEVGGQVRARTTATLVSRIFADVQEVLVQPGDAVRAGQLLVRLDSRELDAQRARAVAAAAAADQAVKAAGSNRDGAEAGLALATATHKRISELRARNSATPNELDQAVGALRAAEARSAGAQVGIREAEAAAEAARAALRGANVGASYAAITAPFAGIVTEKRVEVGNMATPGAPLITMEDARGFRLDVRVDESRVGTLDRARPVDVAVDALERTGTATVTLTGMVSEISRTLDGAHAFLVKIDLPDNAGLRSGMFGRARLGSGSRRALTVPTSALVRHGQLTAVFVVGKDNRARMRLVQVARTSGPHAEIAAGLDSGEQVIVQPAPTLVDGAPVRPVARGAFDATHSPAGTEVGR